jgi:hypothetical protein
MNSKSHNINIINLKNLLILFLICFSYGSIQAVQAIDINSCAQLKTEVEADSDRTFNIISDLDCTGVDLPIYGNLSGEINGNNHTVDNATFDKNNLDYAGFFATVAADANIHDLSFTNLDFTCRDWCGGLIGFADGRLNVDNINIIGSIEARDRVGGLIGQLNDLGLASTVSNCDLNIKIDANDEVSGYIGRAYDIDLTNNRLVADIEAYEIIGGFIGQGFLVRVTDNIAFVKFESDWEPGQSSSAGGIVGKVEMGSILTNNQSYGLIEADSGFVGGQAGQLLNSDINGAFSRVSVYGNGAMGLIAGKSSLANISNVQAHGFVKTKGARARQGNNAGIVGDCDNTDITNTLVDASLFGNADYGGVIGNSFGNNTLENCLVNIEFNIVTNDYDVLINNSQVSDTATNCYWNNELDNTTTSLGLNNGLNNFLNQSDFVGLDFTNDWKMDASKYSYPILRSFESIIEPIALNTCADLNNLANNVTGNYVLTADIDCAGASVNHLVMGYDVFSGIIDGKGHTISNINNNFNSDYNWWFKNAWGMRLKDLSFDDITMIVDFRNSLLAETAVGLEFDKVNFSNINLSGGHRLALVAIELRGSLFRNMNFDHINMDINNTQVAIFANASHHNDYENITFTNIDIEGLRDMGGIAVWSDRDIYLDINFQGEFTGNAIVGALAGQTYRQVSAENITANVTQTYKDINQNIQHIGGLVGYSDTMWDSQVYNNVEISAKLDCHRNCGGLAGTMENGTINDSFASVEITDSNKANGEVIGGLVGLAFNGSSINRSNVIGTIDLLSSKEVGGIVGNFSVSSDIDQVFSNVVINETGASNMLGGGFGHVNNKVDITNILVLGEVNAPLSDSVGGMIGNFENYSGDLADKSTISNSFAAAKVVGNSDVGGFNGNTNPQNTITDSYYNTDYSVVLSSDGGSALNATNVADAANYVNWDMVSIWNIGVNHPLLQIARGLGPSSIKLRHKQVYQVNLPELLVSQIFVTDDNFEQGFEIMTLNHTDSFFVRDSKLYTRGVVDAGNYNLQIQATNPQGFSHTETFKIRVLPNQFYRDIVDGDDGGNNNPNTPPVEEDEDPYKLPDKYNPELNPAKNLSDLNDELEKGVTCIENPVLTEKINSGVSDELIKYMFLLKQSRLAENQADFNDEVLNTLDFNEDGQITIEDRFVVLSFLSCNESYHDVLADINLLGTNDKQKFNFRTYNNFRKAYNKERRRLTRGKLACEDLKYDSNNDCTLDQYDRRYYKRLAYFGLLVHKNERKILRRTRGLRFLKR